MSSANSCKGQSTYTAYPIENTVVGVVRGFFENMRGAVDSDLLEKANRRACSALQKSFEQAEAEYESILKEMNALEEEAIEGTLIFTVGCQVPDDFPDKLIICWFDSITSFVQETVVERIPPTD